MHLKELYCPAAHKILAAIFVFYRKKKICQQNMWAAYSCILFHTNRFKVLTHKKWFVQKNKIGMNVVSVWIG